MKIEKSQQINPNLSRLIISEEKGLKDAMIKINKNGLGICFVVDKEKKLINLLSDGDIRRYLINGLDINSKLNRLPKNNFFYTNVGVELGSIQENIIKYKIIPVLDNNNIVVDYISKNNLYNIPLINTKFNGAEIKYVNDCLDSGWVSSIGKYVKKFEDYFSRKFGFNNSLAVSSGTTGLQLALTALGVGEGDEVILPDLTFAASINAIINAKAIPVLADVDIKTACINVDSVEKLINKKTKAIMPVHLYGNSCDLDSLYKLKEKYNLLIIEDCAEALGTKYHNKQVGVLADAAIFSFFGNKLITTGEGGMVCFKENQIHSKAKILSAHGMNPKKRYWHDQIGFNFRLTNVQAALGLGQLERIESFLKSKISLANVYQELLSKNSSFKFQKITEHCESSYWLITIFLKDDLIFKRDGIISYLLSKGIECRPCFYPLHEMSPYSKYCKKSPENSKYLAYSGISLPTGILSTKEEIEYVCFELNNCLYL